MQWGSGQARLDQHCYQLPQPSIRPSASVMYQRSGSFQATLPLRERVHASAQALVFLGVDGRQLPTQLGGVKLRRKRREHTCKVVTKQAARPHHRTELPRLADSAQQHFADWLVRGETLVASDRRPSSLRTSPVTVGDFAERPVGKRRTSDTPSRPVSTGRLQPLHVLVAHGAEHAAQMLARTHLCAVQGLCLVSSHTFFETLIPRGFMEPPFPLTWDLDTLWTAVFMQKDSSRYRPKHMSAAVDMLRLFWLHWVVARWHLAYRGCVDPSDALRDAVDKRQGCLDPEIDDEVREFLFGWYLDCARRRHCISEVQVERLRHFSNDQFCIVDADRRKAMLEVIMDKGSRTSQILTFDTLDLDDCSASDDDEQDWKSKKRTARRQAEGIVVHLLGLDCPEKPEHCTEMPPIVLSTCADLFVRCQLCAELAPALLRR